MVQTYGIGKAEIDYVLDQLQSIGIVDIGVISQYENSTGRASVRLMRSISGQQAEITSVEVLFIGSNGNGLWASCVGSPCLVIYPRSVVTSMRDRKIDPGKRPFDSTGAKCIPLSTRADAKFNMGFDSFGNFLIQCPTYTVTIDEAGITYANADCSVVKSINDTGSDSQYGRVFNVTDSTHTETYYLNNDEKCAYRFVYKYDGTFTVQRAAYTVWTQEELSDRDSYENWTWETVWDVSGNETETLKDADMNPLVTKSSKVDGSYEYKQVNADGDVLNSIAISAEGDITLSQTKTGNVVELKQDGSCTITTAKGVTIDGTDGNISIKNANYSLADVFNDLITVLDKFATQGSPAAHTAVPGQFTDIQSKLAQFLE